MAKPSDRGSQSLPARLVQMPTETGRSLKLLDFAICQIRQLIEGRYPMRQPRPFVVTENAFQCLRITHLLASQDFTGEARREVESNTFAGGRSHQRRAPGSKFRTCLEEKSEREEDAPPSARRCLPGLGEAGWQAYGVCTSDRFRSESVFAFWHRTPPIGSLCCLDLEGRDTAPPRARRR